MSGGGIGDLSSAIHFFNQLSLKPSGSWKDVQSDGEKYCQIAQGSLKEFAKVANPDRMREAAKIMKSHFLNGIFSGKSRRQEVEALTTKITQIAADVSGLRSRHDGAMADLEQLNKQFNSISFDMSPENAIKMLTAYDQVTRSICKELLSTPQHVTLDRAISICAVLQDLLPASRAQSTPTRNASTGTAVDSTDPSEDASSRHRWALVELNKLVASGFEWSRDSAYGFAHRYQALRELIVPSLLENSEKALFESTERTFHAIEQHDGVLKKCDDWAHNPRSGPRDEPLKKEMESSFRQIIPSLLSGHYDQPKLDTAYRIYEETCARLGVGPAIAKPIAGSTTVGSTREASPASERSIEDELESFALSDDEISSMWASNPFEQNPPRRV